MLSSRGGVVSCDGDLVVCGDVGRLILCLPGGGDRIKQTRSKMRSKSKIISEKRYSKTTYCHTFLSDGCFNVH